ncbi:hypothetical protein IMZ29_07060 [Achromobacter sp. GG226]|uniref:hypothetical protein n=1 Tax=Verticiella alkaliphila TaxID=2779529 RepID=UPI001C0D0608|nr:hypothetical protein [Verticiella sp. GG226]MBU4610306.1 hypothetical protein [Verticiella sp. GG226]
MKTLARFKRALTALVLSIVYHPVFAQAAGGLAAVQEKATNFRDGLIPIVGVSCAVAFIILGALYSKSLINKSSLWVGVVGTIIAGTGVPIAAFFFG